jgi:hypothetical protein
MNAETRSTMSPDEHMSLWVQQWKQAGAALKQIEVQELRAYNYQQHWAIVDDMLQWAYEHWTPRLTSGLVEQQRWFMKLHRQQEQQ